MADKEYMNANLIYIQKTVWQGSMNRVEGIIVVLENVGKIGNQDINRYQYLK